MTTPKTRPDLTFKENLKRGRHGWIRLTPAYSVKIVQQILAENPDLTTILEPFSGTGTTGLVVGQKGLHCDLVDINPFLVWLANVKVANYTLEIREQVEVAAENVVQIAQNISNDEVWLPSISNIQRWWSEGRLVVLGRLFQSINQLELSNCAVHDLLQVAFCKLIIQWSNAAFNHQSMSFKDQQQTFGLFDEDDMICSTFLSDVKRILKGASEFMSGEVQAILGDARDLSEFEPIYDGVITSPPYVNRMSYIRELRPYMYWLGYLNEAREAGELDWQAIGGTWGIATSRLKTWEPERDIKLPPEIYDIWDAIQQQSPVLANYVHKYFCDMSLHFENVYPILKPNAKIFYIVGNSKFYDTLVPTEQLYADMMRQSGFVSVGIETIRKRNSKKELFEYLVSARKPS